VARVGDPMDTEGTGSSPPVEESVEASPAPACAGAASRWKELPTVVPERPAYSCHLNPVVSPPSQMRFGDLELYVRRGRLVRRTVLSGGRAAPRAVACSLRSGPPHGNGPVLPDSGKIGSFPHPGSERPHRARSQGVGHSLVRSPGVDHGSVRSRGMERTAGNSQQHTDPGHRQVQLDAPYHAEGRSCASGTRSRAGGPPRDWGNSRGRGSPTTPGSTRSCRSSRCCGWTRWTSCCSSRVWWTAEEPSWSSGSSGGDPVDGHPWCARRSFSRASLSCCSGPHLRGRPLLATVGRGSWRV